MVLVRKTKQNQTKAPKAPREAPMNVNYLFTEWRHVTQVLGVNLGRTDLEGFDTEASGTQKFNFSSHY